MVEKVFLTENEEYQEHTKRYDNMAEEVTIGVLSSDEKKTVFVYAIQAPADSNSGEIIIRSNNESYRYLIPYEDAIGMMKDFKTKVLIKKRYFFEVRGQDLNIFATRRNMRKERDIWVCELYNTGIVLNTIELQEDDSIEYTLPWVGKEVTEDPKFKESYLVEKYGKEL